MLCINTDRPLVMGELYFFFFLVPFCLAQTFISLHRWKTKTLRGIHDYLMKASKSDILPSLWCNTLLRHIGVQRKSFVW